MRSITKDRYRVIEQLELLLVPDIAHQLNRISNEDLADLWRDVTGCELKYVGDDLFQCEEE
jgi:hypothetical protein